MPIAAPSRIADPAGMLYATTTDTTENEDDALVLRDAVVADAASDPLTVLERHFGFREFRPLQEEIVRDALAGRDVVALMPTGGGKSLCYQLPALVRPGLTVVVSPLIALMKDQVDFLRSRRIAAAVLNSTVAPQHMQAVIDQLQRGHIRLLYVAPERLMQQSFLEKLSRWNVAMFAIDEAHCISDWGHDFRPEYRMLRELRMRFPSVPMMALTATATDRVRTDIITQLGLREPGVYVASFNRPNLTYRIEPKRAPYERLLRFLEGHKGQSGIVYCHTRRQTEGLAARLRDSGYKAVPYHAGLEQPVRARNQDLFLRDQVQIVCATIAFGMGVDKPNIRYVVHYDLPKNIEGYYQETGRAGRDGDPGECLLLFGKADVINHERRADEKETEHERAIARAALDALVQFSESRQCRRRELLAYFGEEYGEAKCGGCDNCLGIEPISRDGALAPSASTDDYDPELFERLRAKRLALAKARDVKAFVIAHDSVLKALAAARPTTTKALSRIRGLGGKRGETVGAEFVETIREYAFERAAPDEEDARQIFRRLLELQYKLLESGEVESRFLVPYRTLGLVAEARPSNKADLMAISGFGEQKVEVLGERFLSVIAGELATTGA